MGRDLFEGSQAARHLFETADRILGYALSALCFEGPAERLQETQAAQPAIFVTSLACLEAARELGGLPAERPAFVAGHSLGEYSAIVAAGALEFEDALRLVQERGRLMHEAAQSSPGAMAAIIGLDEDAVRSVCQQAGAEVCNLNAPGQVVIGGTTAAIDGALALALERGAQRGVRLNVSGAFHTSLMAPAAESMARALQDAPVAAPEVPVVANSTARALRTADDVRRELGEQIVRPVYWQRSVEYMRDQGVAAFIEFGPGRVLSGLIRRIDRSLGVRNVSGLAGAQSSVTPSASPP
jgi:[acyl-carrier-protein] S-malonyltransferase